MATIPGGGAHALIAPYYGSGSGQTCTSVDEPLPAVTTRDRFGLIVPITHVDGANRARSLDQPLPTLTTAKRGELAFVTAAFGERAGQAPRVHSLEDPMPTVLAQGRVNLAQAALNENEAAGPRTTSSTGCSPATSSPPRTASTPDGSTSSRATRPR
jgi:hypothetical protein